MLFRDRRHAGRILAEHLAHYMGRTDLLVLALPRGGVPVACEVACSLSAPLDVFLVRKLGLPDQPELAMGAIASGGVQVLNEEVVRAMHISSDEIAAVAVVEQQELERRERAFREDRPRPQVQGKTVILIDDGLATGSSMRAAARAVRQLNPARLVIAVPVAAKPTCRDMRAEADEVVCPHTPEPFYAVGLYYQNFSQTSDAEVRQLLAEVSHHAPAHPTLEHQ